MGEPFHTLQSSEAVGSDLGQNWSPKAELVGLLDGLGGRMGKISDSRSVGSYPRRDMSDGPDLPWGSCGPLNTTSGRDQKEGL